MTYPTTEQVEQARQASLADFFTQNGFETDRIRNELHVKGYGGLYVNTETNEWYCFSQAEKHGGRNAINCLTDIIGMDFKSAVESLSCANMTYMDYHKAVPKLPQIKELVLPERADNMRKVFAYLCQTRRLDSKLVSELAHNGLLYQDKRGNAVFLHKDENGNSIGAEIQGTNSEKRYKGVAPGTSDSLFSVTLGTPTKAYIFESAIDLLSFRQLANRQKIQDSVLVSMAGLKPNSLKTLSDKGLQLFACVDNDEAGRKFVSSNNLTQRNPNLKVFNAVMHLDEATPHLHIDFVPITHTGSRGLSTRVSMSGALREMGFAPENKFLTEWVAWSDSERAVMEKILREHGLYRDDKNVHREH